MNSPCSKCGMQLAPSWTFCPHCGITVTHEIQLHNPPPPHEKTSIKGGFGGLFVGLVITPVFLIVGTLLCLTGLGALLGVPMIVAGIIAPLAGPIFGLGEHKGKCPSCGTRVISFSDGLGHDCPACNREFVVDSHASVKAG
jgi:predicted RNA-binding Zn-ribbon protein involved in translation (DUF1610 family)